MDELWCRYSYVWVSIEVGIASTLSDLSPLLGCCGVQCGTIAKINQILRSSE